MGCKKLEQGGDIFDGDLLTDAQPVSPRDFKPCLFAGTNDFVEELRATLEQNKHIAFVYGAGLPYAV
ncbi:MAG: hypothetical protein K0U50_09980, partial [Alphaproteobacteria bacterium]|nr:hypothetical protein [Alphaproteobacteria bacterium]